MGKLVVITGSTDGIGLEAARRFVDGGHEVVLHGRNLAKLEGVRTELEKGSGHGSAIHGAVADLSRLPEVERLAQELGSRFGRIDALVHNAGVFAVADPRTERGLDVRFVVNALAPYVLTWRLLPSLGSAGRIVNLSSAAQSPVDLEALAGRRRLSDADAYAQSKLALTMWSFDLARRLGEGGPSILAVNPGSKLATKMVRQAYGVEGADPSIGSELLERAVLDGAFERVSGRYYDNDQRRFADPHPDALDAEKCGAPDTRVGARSARGWLRRLDFWATDGSATVAEVST